MLLPRLQRHVFTCWVITTNELLIAFKELDSALFLPNTNQHLKCYFRYRLVICDSRVDNIRSLVHLSTIAQIIQHVYVKPFTLKFKNQLFVCIKYDFLISYACFPTIIVTFIQKCYWILTIINEEFDTFTEVEWKRRGLTIITLFRSSQNLPFVGFVWINYISA